MVYLNQKRVKLFVKGLGMRIRKDAMRCLDERVESLIMQAKRNAGGMKTITKEDVALAK